MNFKAACIQINSQNDIEHNIQQIETLIKKAVKQGADFVFLPENAGFMGANAEDLFANVYFTEEHPVKIAIEKLALELGIWVLIGSLAVKVAGSQKLANRSILLNDKGQVVDIYDKIHLYDASVKGGESHKESDRYISGDKMVISNTPWGQLGLTICYDLRFPYLFRNLAKLGAKIITVPSAFTQFTGNLHWHVLLRARAIENGCYIIAPAQTGEHPAGRKTYGHSLIINPWGEIIAECDDKVGTCLAAIDLSLVDEARQQIQSLNHDRDI